LPWIMRTSMNHGSLTRWCSGGAMETRSFHRIGEVASARLTNPSSHVHQFAALASLQHRDPLSSTGGVSLSVCHREVITRVVRSSSRRCSMLSKSFKWIHPPASIAAIHPPVHPSVPTITILASLPTILADSSEQAFNI
jgi:hypothetical protein